MKQTITGTVRRVAPKAVAHALRRGYHLARTHAASARYRYPARYLKVIAVVGTTGKSTTAHYLDSVLKSAGFTTALLGSDTTEIAGVSRPAADVLTAGRVQRFLRFAKKADVDYVVVEAASWALRTKLFQTVAFECVVVTNAETAEDVDAIAQVLAYVPRYIVLNADDPSYSLLSGYEAAEHKMSYGTSEVADSRIRQVKLYRKGSEAQLLIDHHTKLELGTELPGKHNVYNMTAAAMAAYLMYIKLEAIQDGIAEQRPIPGRFERVDTDKPYEVIIDRARTPDALEKLLEAIRGMTKNRLILVIGARGDWDKSQRLVMGEIATRLADRIFLTDEESRDEDPEVIRRTVMEGIVSAGGEPKVEEIADRRDAIAKATSVARTGDTVLIVGMGDEQYRVVGGQHVSWNDGAVVHELATPKTDIKPLPEVDETEETITPNAIPE